MFTIICSKHNESNYYKPLKIQNISHLSEMKVKIAVQASDRKMNMELITENEQILTKF